MWLAFGMAIKANARTAVASSITLLNRWTLASDGHSPKHGASGMDLWQSRKSKEASASGLFQLQKLAE
jgi:hypothetical protein